MATTYLALRRLKIGDGYREIGEEVPEAAGWRNLRSLLRSHFVEAVDSSEVELTVDAEATADEGLQQELESLAVPALKARAKAEGRTGYSKLNKADLVALLLT